MAAGRSKKRIPYPRVVTPKPPFTTVDEAVAEIAKGRMVIVVDDEDRENEGDLTMAAESITAEDVAFIRKYASGVICVPMTADRLGELDKKMTALDRRLIGQMVTEGDPALFGGAAWADVLSRRLRISRGEAQRRITEARSA